MKKFILIIPLLLGIAAGAAAQEDGKDRLDELESIADKVKTRKSKKAEKLVNFDILHRFGYGYNTALDFKGLSTKRSDSREIWFNAAALTLNAASFFSVDLALNLKWDRYMADGDNYIYLDSEREIKFADISVQKAQYPAASDFKVIRSQIGTFALEIPLGLDFHWNDFSFRAGAAAGLITSAVQKERIEYGYTAVGKKVYEAAVNPFYYSFFGEISFSDIGVYVKYTPAEIIPGAFKQMLSIGISAKL